MDNNNLGLGVLLGLFSDNSDSVVAFLAGKDQVISGLEIVNNELLFTFSNGYKMVLFDDGQSCCEYRYMTCDDNLADFIGATLIGAETRDLPNLPEDEYGDVHEVAFLIVHTSLGDFTCETHNEHNGYYGGFLVRARAITD